MRRTVCTTHSRAWRRLVGGVVLAALALLAIACAASVRDAPTSQTSQSSLTASPAPETTSAAPQSRECMVTAGAGSIDKTGYGSVNFIDRVPHFACETGPD